MAFPSFSELAPTIYNNIKTHGKGASVSSTNKTADASNLVPWIRLISGTGKGLIMVSNPELSQIIDSFIAIPDGNNGTYINTFPGMYGSSLASGYIGYNWDGNVVYGNTGNFALRPSPLITALEIKEGKDQISREGKVTIKCFTLEQAEAIQNYCMEPGHSLLVEYGWNTQSGISHLIDVNGDIVSQASQVNLNNNNLHAKRIKSNGNYDSFLGFIVGGNTTSSDNTFIITVSLRGMPGLPTWLQSHRNINKIVLDSTTSKKTIAPFQAASPFGTSDIEETGAITGGILLGKRRYKYMFNQLPPERQTNEVKAVVNLVSAGSDYGYWDLLNFDYSISKQIEAFQNDSVGWKFWTRKGTTIEIDNASIPKEKLISKNKYINFGVAIRLLNANNGLTSYKIGDKNIKVSISPKGDIGAFPYMFSTKPSKLIIPGRIPDFYDYYLNTGTVDVNSIIKNTMDGKWVDNSIPGVGGSGTSNAGWYSFVQYDKDLEPPLIDEKKPTGGRKNGNYEIAGYWGRLDFLYINFDVFVSAIKNSSNKSIRDVLIQMLNEMSSAVNSFWNFQLVEKQEGDTIVIQIVDANWSGKNTKKIHEFFHSGEQSVFLEANLDIDVPAEMTNQIILKREGYTSNPDSHPIKIGGIFSEDSDMFFKGIQYNGYAADTTPGGGAPAARTPDVILQEIETYLKSLTRDNKWSGEGGGTAEDGFYAEGDDGGGATWYSMWQDGSGSYVVKMIGSRSSVEDIKFDRNQWEIQKTPAGKLLKEKVSEYDKALADAENAKQNNVDANLDKIDIIPNPEVATLNTNALSPSSDPADGGKTTGGFSEFNKNFKIYCCKDSQIFDVLRNNMFEQYSDTGKTSTLLPIKYTFKILGKSGLRRGDVFNIDGIPPKYKKHGFFQIVEIEQNLSENQWTTTVTGQYRQTGK